MKLTAKRMAEQMAEQDKYRIRRMADSLTFEEVLAAINNCKRKIYDTDPIRYMDMFPQEFCQHAY